MTAHREEKDLYVKYLRSGQPRRISYGTSPKTVGQKEPVGGEEKKFIMQSGNMEKEKMGYISAVKSCWHPIPPQKSDLRTQVVVKAQARSAPPEGRTKSDAILTHEVSVSDSGLESESLEDAREIMKMLRQQPRFRSVNYSSAGSDVQLPSPKQIISSNASSSMKLSSEAPFPDRTQHVESYAQFVGVCQRFRAEGDELHNVPQLIDSLDLSAPQEESKGILSSGNDIEVQSVLTPRACSGTDEVSVEVAANVSAAASVPGERHQHFSRVTTAWNEKNNHCERFSHRRNECLQVDSTTGVDKVSNAQSAPATYTTLKQNRVPKVQTMVSRPAVHTARWGQGLESESERKKRLLREKAKAFASECRGRIQEVVAKNEADHDSETGENIRPVRRTENEVSLQPKIRNRADRSMLSMEEDQLMESLARLDLKLMEKPTKCAANPVPLIPTLPATRHTQQARPRGSERSLRARVYTGNTNTFLAAASNV